MSLRGLLAGLRNVVNDVRESRCYNVPWPPALRNVKAQAEAGEVDRTGATHAIYSRKDKASKTAPIWPEHDTVHVQRALKSAYFQVSTTELHQRQPPLGTE